MTLSSQIPLPLPYIEEEEEVDLNTGTRQGVESRWKADIKLKHQQA